MKTFLAPAKWMLFLGAPIFALGVAAMILNFSFAAVVVAVLGGALLGFWIKDTADYGKYYGNLEQNGQLPALEEDFAAAESVLKGKIRLGRDHLYLRHEGRAVPYGDVLQAYQKVTKTYGVETDRDLMLLLRGHRFAASAGKLKTRGKSDEEMIRIVSFLQSKNPSLKIGYR